MRYPREWYQMHEVIAEHLPMLRPAQQRGLALWVYGAILAGSACQHAVIAALLVMGEWDALRQQLREWLYDGKDKAAPCQTQVDVTHCFGPLLQWVLAWWQSQEIALAVDVTLLGDRVAVLVVSVLYRGSAIPVAWHVLPANQEGAWMTPILRLLRWLGRAMPPTMTVLVLVDRGLYSSRLWKRIRDLGWHPLLRLQTRTCVQPVGGSRQAARRLACGPGHAWVGRCTVFKDRKKQRTGTVLLVWAEDQADPWVVLTDLPPEHVGLGWYGLRMWVELGFRALKGVGWQWQHTRRTHPDRVTRHWLVLAVAMLWTLAYGTRIEDAERLGVPPGRLHAPPVDPHGPAHRTQRRLASLFRLGLARLQVQLGRGRLWRRLWLRPEPWPNPPPGLLVAVHQAA